MTRSPTLGRPICSPKLTRSHVSVTFTQDRAIAERLAEQWKVVAPTKIGGVAYNDASLEFIPGRYVKPGYTITSPALGAAGSAGCGVLAGSPLPIYELERTRRQLAGVPARSRRVRRYAAPAKKPHGRIEFTGGLEALSLQDYQVDLLASLRPRPNMFFAYDPGDAFETLESAASRMLAAGFTARSHRLRAYVLIGYQGQDSVVAEPSGDSIRMMSIGITPTRCFGGPDTPSQEKHAPGVGVASFQRNGRGRQSSTGSSEKANDIPASLWLASLVSIRAMPSCGRMATWMLDFLHPNECGSLFHNWGIRLCFRSRSKQTRLG